nr:uncharacterized protein LOC112773148 isoform X3 [Arachis hypogaea]
MAMAKAKLVSLLLLALLIAISAISAQQVMAKEAAQYHLDSSAHLNVLEDVGRHSTTSHACSSAKNVVLSAFVFLLATMATRLSAPATTTGRPSVEDPSALES